MEFLGDSHLLLLKSELIDSQTHTHTPTPTWQVEWGFPSGEAVEDMAALEVQVKRSETRFVLCLF